ncbi:hypothetical protein [Thiorhodococcus minor]|uniref:DUF2834 domain-containing protein n=1 Tax=Thiorhodococcus minor TaxID=57489 RepID=A0A6M0K339_9GAMM|nr:hypothetical protein [Thiorhodococcus minor]NEV63714.1 hypothetical protein [Thiorhodococcus minor]
MRKFSEAFKQSLRFPQALIWLLWIAFPLYGFIATHYLLPPEDGYTKQVVVAAFTADFSAVEPLVIAVFNLLGVIPMTYALLVLFDGKEQPLPAWPFVILSFFAGAFGILFYVALRRWGTAVQGSKTGLQQQLDTWKIPAVLLVVAIALVLLGTTGSVQDYVELWRTKPLVHVMTIDLVLLLLVLPFLAIDDMQRRQIRSPAWRVLALVLPLFGVLLYLLARPKLADQPAA